MSLTLELPESVEQELRRVWGDQNLPSKATEALILAAYREGLISRGRVGELLSLGFAEREQYLKQLDVPYNYGPEELAEDQDTIAALSESRR